MFIVLAEAINNNAGLGFNGYDKTGKPKWDLLDNVDIIKLEVSFKMNGILVAKSEFLL